MPEKAVRKRRVAVPAKFKEQMLKDFNYRCALCGGDRPHVHHIDENPANNEPLNLLPLCPSCHISDQHDPTRGFDPVILRLLRKYRDPTVLSPQFIPLYRKLDLINRLCNTVFLKTTENREECQEAFRSLKVAVDDLVGFIKCLNMGPYYSRRVYQALGGPLTRLSPGIQSQNEIENSSNEVWNRIMLDLIETEIIIIESLRYQDWKPPQPR